MPINIYGEETSERQKKKAKTVFIIADSPNLMAKPSLDSEIIIRDSKETTLEVIGEFTEVTGDKWYKVRTSLGRECWITAKVARLSPELQ